MLKVNFGCGQNYLTGWENHDIEVDIRNPLPYKDSSVDFIFIEHCIEHVNIHEAFRFFQRSFKILKHGGVIRVSVPCIDSIYKQASEPYLEWLRRQGWGDGTKESAVYNIVFNHGHQTIWTTDTLSIMLLTAGFYRTTLCSPMKSEHSEFCNIEGHGRIIGHAFNCIETGVVEATKN